MIVGFDAKRAFHNTTGLGNYSRDIIRILSHYFPENSYVLYNPKPRKPDLYFPGNDVIVSYPDSFLNKKFSSIWRSKCITGQLRKDNINLYHGLSNELPYGIRKTKIKAIVTIHDLIFMRYPQWYHAVDRYIYVQKAKNAVKNADKIIAISEQTRNDIIDFLKVPPEKIEVIYQGCHHTFKQSYTEKEINLTKEKFCLPLKFLLSVGTIEERKNLLTVVKSLNHHSLPLVVVGKETKYIDRIHKYIDSNHLRERIHFIRPSSMQELAIIYQLATVFCYMSVFEGFGIPIIESLYSRTPVIATKGGCFIEAGGPNSIYIDYWDDKALGEKINRLLNDESLNDYMIEKGFDYVRRFNDPNIAFAMMELYNKLIHS